MRLETGKDIDHRTNTTVSRPGQFRVALRNLWSSTADGFYLSKDRQFRWPDVAHACSLPCRHSCRHSRDRLSAGPAWTSSRCTARPATGKKTIGKQPFFWTPFGGVCEVQSTGARGASHKQKGSRRGYRHLSKRGGRVFESPENGANQRDEYTKNGAKSEVCTIRNARVNEIR